MQNMAIIDLMSHGYRLIHHSYSQQNQSMDSKNRKNNLDNTVKYLHPFSPSPSHNGHRHNPATGAEGRSGAAPIFLMDAAEFEKI